MNAAVIDRQKTADQFRKLRGNKSQTEVANAMGVSKQYVSSMERGREDFTEGVMERIRKAFPDFQPIRISVIGNTTTVNTNQGKSIDADATLDQANRILENANRTMELAIRLLENAADATGKNR